MAQASVTVNRADRATNILASGGVIEMEHGGYVVVDPATGSGRGHVTTETSCDCKDRQFRGGVCKHMRALRAALGIACCPTCGAATVKRAYRVGGRGLVDFNVCTVNVEHRAVPA